MRITFKPVPMLYDDDILFSGTLKNISSGVYDFVILPPTLTLCATSLRLAHLLVRVRSKTAYATENGLPPGGGVIFTRAHNYAVRGFQDLRGRVVVVTE